MKIIRDKLRLSQIYNNEIELSNNNNRPRLNLIAEHSLKKFISLQIQEAQDLTDSESNNYIKDIHLLAFIGEIHCEKCNKTFLNKDIYLFSIYHNDYKLCFNCAKETHIEIKKFVNDLIPFKD